MIFSALFLLAAAQGAPWYYPDASTARVPISDAFEMGRRVVVGLGLCWESWGGPCGEKNSGTGHCQGGVDSAPGFQN